ncbi:T3SS effector HopA1 family protein [Streptomyces sp. NBC_00847]|uniref:T3SS effector HopA1 family protein n=1 Tax=Streptomyces sp. NBC_00847 TaxID=2975850 RepID=UPI0022587F3F|nr:T3SS effector HopA1 family protein [Streptomyces sp. NBC_00847]MCX4880358.1 T3SS effector HopA1 family protein [Streptomyces sp. NBC_00847]
MTAQALDPRVLAIEQAVNLRPELLEAQIVDEKVTAKTERALRGAVSDALYGHFHTGLGSAKQSVPPREPELEQRYASRVPHGNSRVNGVAAPQSAGAAAVFDLNGVRVEFPARSVLASDGDRNVLSIGAQRPNLSPGFFAVIGSKGWTPSASVLRVYVNVGTVQTAVQAWGLALEHLEETEAVYQAKVVSRANLVSRRDGMVFYLDAAAHPLMPGLARKLSRLALPIEVPDFTQSLAPGISYAWEPTHDSSQPRRSFGLHRARAITAALFDQTADPHKPFAMHARERLIEFRIEPTGIHRNIDSPLIQEDTAPLFPWRVV